jgi:hypothetical protein
MKVYLQPRRAEELLGELASGSIVGAVRMVVEGPVWTISRLDMEVVIGWAEWSGSQPHLKVTFALMDQSPKAIRVSIDEAALDGVRHLSNPVLSANAEAWALRALKETVQAIQYEQDRMIRAGYFLERV